MRKMNATEIKKIAIVAMTIDHIAWILLNDMLCSYIMHVIGRITAPIMWFFIAEGCYYTRDWKKYFIRMMGFAVVSHFAYCYYEGMPLWHHTSVLWPLALSVILIKICNSSNLPNYVKILPIILLILGSIPSDWGVLALIMPAVLYKCRHSFKIQAGAIAVSGILAALFTQAPWPYRFLQLFVVLSIPILANYNNEQGEGSKWFFYIYYPLHLVFLGIYKRILICMI
nr:conjugal transfer protein TraX [Clostridia bacterium]